MSDQDYPANKGQDIEDEQNPEASDAPPFPNPENVDEGGDGESDGEASAKIAKLNDQLLRLAAELENTRRRGEREKREAGQYAIAGFARDLIGVADNFERAMQAAGVSGDDIPEGRSDAFKSLVDGIQLVEKEMITALHRHGVKKVEPAGERFDPNLHQAVANVPSSTIPKGHVVDVAQPGFTIGERVLRAAMVTVSSGQPSEEPGSQVDEEA